jgi:ribose transport system permease protein
MMSGAPEAAVRWRGQWRHRLAGDAGALALRAGLFVLLGLALALASDSYLSSANVLNVMRQAILNFLHSAALTRVIL